jgi:hypothetical protein
LNTPEWMPDRRSVLRRVAVGAGATLLAPREAKASAKLPSVLLLGGLGCTPPDSTAYRRLPPATARLAREGFCFENFRSDYPFLRSPWSDLLAGRWQTLGREDENATVPKTTLASAFSRAGYLTIYVRGRATPRPAVLSGFGTVISWSGGEPDGLAELAVHQARRFADRPFFMAIQCGGGPAVNDSGIGHLLEEVETREKADGISIFYAPLLGRAETGNAVGLCWPMIVYSRTRVFKNRRSSVAMNVLDVAPTVCGFAGIPVPADFAGIDYSALAAAPRSRNAGGSLSNSSGMIDDSVLGA